MLQTNSKSVFAADDEERQCKMISGGFGDEKLREKMVVEGDDDSWTVDCLRSRLVAERAASRVAKEDAELLGRKLMELERQLKLEIKSRNRAEKILKLATKKLESLKLSAVLGQSSSPESEGSRSSSTCSTGLQESDGRKSTQTEEKGKCNMENIQKVTDPLLSEDFRCVNSAAVATNAVNQVPCYEQSSSSVDPAHSSNNEDDSQEDASEFKDSLSSRESTTDALRQSSVGGEVERKQDHVEYTDNVLAIIPANMWPEPKTCESQNNNKINDVLLALRHAKEHLQSSIGIIV